MTYDGDNYDERKDFEEEDLEVIRNLHGGISRIHDEEMSNIKFVIPYKKLHPKAKAPRQATPGSAAFDVYTLESVLLQPGVTTIVKTGLALALPKDHDLKILPRSGLSSKGVVIRNSPGLIDEDYRGEVCVLLKYEPENLCLAIIKLYKELLNFTKNLVSSHQFNLDTAKKKLGDGMKNLPFEPYLINAGDRIAQVQLNKVVPMKFSERNELPETQRGSGGFGSTGD